jgi:uncharacterized protein
MQRDAGNGYSTFSVQLVKKKLLETGEPFHLFGGEPLLMKISDLEDLLSWEYERNGENLIQTNGTILTQEHIYLFKKYNVKVGVSIDGPDELNDIRWNGSIEKTRNATEKTIRNIENLISENLLIGIQIQITKCNSIQSRLPKMFKWLRHLDKMGLQSARLHILEIDNPIIRQKFAFSFEENIEVFSKYHEFEKTLTNLRFDIFNDMRNMLLGKDENSTCTWRACDPYTTEAVKGMDGEGRMSNCGLTDKEGVNFQKPDTVGYERYIALYHTPQDYGGCNGCRFFLVCKGQCPGTAINGDWRNKSENCGVWMHFFEKLESDIIGEGEIPLSCNSAREKLEREMLIQWSQNNNPTLQSLLISINE